MAESLSDSEFETRKDLIRKSKRVRKVTENYQILPHFSVGQVFFYLFVATSQIDFVAESLMKRGDLL